MAAPLGAEGIPSSGEDGPEVLRYAAFAADAAGGNPAGVVLDAGDLDDSAMQGIAATVGYAETAFVVARSQSDARSLSLRYFSPIAEVPFCGHATIATAVALAEREGAGAFSFSTPVGAVIIDTVNSAAGVTATFSSVEPAIRDLPGDTQEELLALLGLDGSDLDPRYAPLEAFAGNWHPVVVVADRDVFDGFRFDPAAVRRLMDLRGWSGTVTVLHARGPHEFEARNLFPVGVITEDPATGSAAAALGGYLRLTGLIEPPATVLVHQGRHVGRNSVLMVEIPPSGGIRVSGGAVPIVP